ncbi:Putative berberine/berberine, FAD-binding domain, PCMH-type, FAD-binding, type PCMH, subdomain 2 [Colletotrichum destructivum]|uniref:Berberine/berberine, FAD-binding domain, PCMH-type, FAD-binding, type PCMH, subdomain 2 n=1 Tax=Colletotrichum destructivum TaxID=34406 RepID=A0AAX4IUN0_9PEZI|nr:Putative berberine/berberine, FAD-binding domain, PCMH-type, FAD-binding, type PCMH, subdomain 2 [Colletotrichum destructivum]
MRFTSTLSWAAAALPLTSAKPFPQTAQAAKAGNSSNTIQACLSAANAPVTVSSSSDWSEDIRPYNARVQFTPALVVAATDASHVQAAVRCASQYGKTVTARGGGHSYSSSGLGGENGHVVVRLDEMFGVTLNADSTATVQAGARLGHVATELFKQGGRAISHGSCPGVGASGHSIHGGFGFSSHLYGLATDWIVEATVVTADGKIVKASQSQNPDLFWAIRGAGSSFGIITEFKFNTFAAPSVVTWYKVPFNLKKDKLVAALAALQTYAQGDMPAELNMRAVITSDSTAFDGLYIGTEAQTRSVLKKFLSPLGIDVGGATLTQTNWIGQLEHFAGEDLDQTGPQDASDTFYASSLMTKAVSQDGFKAFVNYYLNTAQSTYTGWFVLVDVHGGKNSKTAQVANSATAYAHRDKVLMWQFYDSSGEEAYPSSGYSFLGKWMSSVTATMAKADWGRYANYADSQLSKADAQDQYYRDNLPRLKTIKTKYDAKGIFTYPQGVGS